MRFDATKLDTVVVAPVTFKLLKIFTIPEMSTYKFDPFEEAIIRYELRPTVVFTG